ncbi:MAG: hypothetical protein LBO05_12940 [Deltaproteobacteria bacterium]|jgi:hypothetical protein|nr:hypothetical protein [Deltaproteobacteria bacterium]
MAWAAGLLLTGAAVAGLNLSIGDRPVLGKTAALLAFVLPAVSLVRASRVKKKIP